MLEPKNLNFQFRTIDYNDNVYHDLYLGRDKHNKPIFVNDIVIIKYLNEYVYNSIVTPCIILFDDVNKSFYLSDLKERKHYFSEYLTTNMMELIKASYYNSADEDERNQ